MNPTCWEDVWACQCNACRQLTQIHARCMDLGEPLFVCDCRMYGVPNPWCVGDVDRLFVAPTPEHDMHPNRQEAIDAVLKTQRHCDVFESSWPLRPWGSNDYLWTREVAA